MATTRPVLSASREGRHDDKPAPTLGRLGSRFSHLSTSTNTQHGEGSNQGEAVDKFLTPTALTTVVSSLKKMNVLRQRTLAMKGNVTASCPLRKFDPSEVEREIKRILESVLKSVEYEPERAASLSKRLSETIRGKVKAMKFPRYKIVAMVAITSKTGPCLMLGSRCLWNAGSDASATATYTTDKLSAMATVFAILKE